jgi:hypothetical protein
LIKGPHQAAPEKKEAKMYSSTYLNCFRRLLILGAVVAGLTATAAGAAVNTRPPDVLMALHFKHEDRIYGRTGGDLGAVASTASVPTTVVSRPPDVQDAAASVSAATPDVFERYATEHPYGFDLTSSELVSSPPDVQDAASALHSTPADLKADGLRVQGVSGTWEHQLHSPATTSQYPTLAGLKADGLRWQGIARAYEQQSDKAVRPDDRPGPLGVGEPTSVAVAGGPGFDYDDWAIGIGTGLGLALLVGVGFMVGRQQRHRVQPA